MGLLTGTRVAIDGSKFKAVNNRDRNFTQGKLDRRRQQIEESVSRYLSQLDTADRQDPTPELAAKVVRLKEKIARLGQEMERLAGLEEQMKAAPDRQISLTDPDARSMATSGRGSGLVGYNVQVAVETEHHLIVAHTVTNAGSDRAQLSGMAVRAKQALETDTLDAVADRGYYSGQEILACERAGISVTRYLSKRTLPGFTAEGLQRVGSRTPSYALEQTISYRPMPAAGMAATASQKRTHVGRSANSDRGGKRSGTPQDISKVPLLRRFSLLRQACSFRLPARITALSLVRLRCIDHSLHRSKEGPSPLDVDRRKIDVDECEDGSVAWFGTVARR